MAALALARFARFARPAPPNENAVAAPQRRRVAAAVAATERVCGGF